MKRDQFLSRTLAAALCLLLCLTAAFSACADGQPWDGWERSLLLDRDDLLSEDERTEVGDRLAQIARDYAFDAVALTVPTLDGMTPAAYAEGVFTDLHFGQGANGDGVLLLVCMESRDWYLATHGFGKQAFSDSDIDSLGSTISPYLKEGDVAGAFLKFADECEFNIDWARDHDPDAPRSVAGTLPGTTGLLIAFVIGLVIALITVAVMKGKLKTVRSQPAADSYVRENSMIVTGSSDLFLYRTVDRRARPKDNDNSSSSSDGGGGGGGSDFGGGGGKF